MLHFFLGMMAATAVLAPLGWYWMARAESRRAEAESRRARSDAEARRIEKLADLGTLAGGLAHEIKNPLSTLSMNLQLLEEDLATAQTSAEKRCAERIKVLRSETARLSDILDDFLRFARDRRLDCERCDLRQIVGEVLTFIAPDAQQRRIDLWPQLPHQPMTVEVDRNLIKQAVLNILLNAEEAISEKGQIIVRLAERNGRAALDFIDTGCGIVPENLRRVFEIYFSTKEKGTGLGLATSRRIIERHGGSIRIESEAGRGTDVTVELPLAAEKGA